MAVLHSKAIHEDSAVSVGVSFELHCHGDIVANIGFLEWLVRLDTLSIPHEDGCVLGGLD